MKKIFTLALMAIMALSVNAKSWDFTKWSSTTKALLTSSSDWTMDEKGSGSPYLEDNECLWNSNANQWDEEGNVTVGGTAIPEMKGIQFTVLAARALAIGLNYPQTLDANKWGPYHGPQYLWVNKAASTTFILKDIKPGTTIKMGIESHKPSDGRGVDLDINGTALTLISGQETCRPKTYEEFEWQVPEGDENVDINVKPSAGCHIYFIKCGDDEPSGETSKIGLLYYEAAGEGFAELPLYKALKDNESFSIEGIKIDDETPSAEKLQSYDAIVLDGSIPADADLVAALKNNIQWQPVLNVNADLAEAFGYGTKVAQTEGAESEMAVVLDKNKSWFAGFEGMDDVTGEGDYGYGMTMGEIWPVPMKLNGNHAKAPKYIVWLDADYAIHNDSVLAYVYCQGHNEYAYYGAKGDYNEGTETILQNILAEVASSKSEITATKTPTFTEEYGDMQTTLTIKCSTPNAEIHYTIDGSEPTLNSPVYTVPVLFTEAATVKAIAIADGYTLGNAAETKVSIKSMAKAPVISIDGSAEKGNVTVTLSSEEDVDIYYNFTGKATDPSSLYTAPISVNTTTTIYAYAVGKEGVALIASDLVSEKILANIKNIRRDELAHFYADASWSTLSTDETTTISLNGEPQLEWKNGSLYYFTWGKSAVVSEENVSDDPIIDPETGDPMLDDNGNLIYEKKDREPEVTTNVSDPDWKLVSQGQVMVYQKLTFGKNVGDGGAYNPESATDLINVDMMTSNCVQFGARPSGDKYNARIESTKKFQAPFNVLTFVGTGNGKEKVAVQISTDGKEWKTVGDTLSCSETKRLWKQFEVAYEGTDEVYVRVAHISSGSAAQIVDIYVLNEGEKSKEMEKELATGISEVTEAETIAPARFANGIYNIAGQKVNKNYKGLVIKHGSKYMQK